MDYKVIKEFNDKDTGNNHAIDTFYKTDSKERVQFLQDNGFIEKGDFLSGSIPEITEASANLTSEEIKKHLDAEKKGQKRKTLIKHFEDALKDDDNNDQSGKVQA